MNFKINNGMILDIKQDTADGEVIVSHQDREKTENNIILQQAIL